MDAPWAPQLAKIVWGRVVFSGGTVLHVMRDWGFMVHADLRRYLLHAISIQVISRAAGQTWFRF